MNAKNKIAKIADADLPREKAMRLGIGALTDAELLAILFGTGIVGKSVLELSADILADNDHHLSRIARLSVRDFQNRYKGIGPAKAISVLAALELGARSARDAASIEDKPVLSSALAYEHMRSLGQLPHEEFWVMLLSRSNRVIRTVNIGRGGLAATVVDIKLVMKHALENLASAMILFHNHPSGNLMPSAQDNALTQRIKQACELMDIRLNDHLIISDAGYYSYHDQGNIL